MERKIYINRYMFLEEQINDYMRILLVKSPEQVLQYFETQVNKYTTMLKWRTLYPAIVVVFIQNLIVEYSFRIFRIKEYINYKNEDCCQDNVSKSYVTTGWKFQKNT